MNISKRKTENNYIHTQYLPVDAVDVCVAIYMWEKKEHIKKAKFKQVNKYVNF